MTLYSGDTITLRARAFDPYDSSKLLDPMPLEAEVSFWAPGIDYRSSQPTHGPYPMDRLEPMGVFQKMQDTTGWERGTWVWMVKVRDVYENREYSKFVVE